VKIDIAKRRRVMERSRLLGHCICDPRRGCPCEVFTDQGFCPCAGERPDPVDLSQVKLTKLVRNAGCASKIAPADLDAVLTRLPEVRDPAVISGLAAGDDAAIYRIADNLCLVQTVDVFTPCVDDPHLFGRICAANCLSDIYAMGGDPRTALSVLAFPSETLPGEIMFKMLAGAMETLGEASVALIGGHSVKDDEIKLGFAITGTIDPTVAAALEKPQPGDVLVLTKPLGTGVLTFAQQIGRGHAKGWAAAQASMSTLNKPAAEAMKEAGASACTDITGFGLFGHLIRMMRQSGLTAEVFADALPAFPGVVDALQQGVIPGAIERNREYVGDDLSLAPGVDEARVHLGFDAQTSGGLLIAVPSACLPKLERALSDRGTTGFVIGRIVPEPAGGIHVICTPKNLQASAAPNHGGPSFQITMNSKEPTPQPHGDGCCSDVSHPPGTAPVAPVSSIAESQRAFGVMMRAVQANGVLDERTKEVVLFGLVVYSRCTACFDAHYRRARSMGISATMLDEAAWCAIAMGGAPVRMFYQECLARVQKAAPPAGR
jgi:selenide, water dikinase